MTKTKPRPVFISYSRKDRGNPRLREILRQLTDRHGARFWMWEDELVPGDSVIDAISGQIDRAASVLIIVFRDSATSRFGRVEWGIAQAREAMRMLPTVVALRLDNVEIPGPLAHLNVLDAEGDLEDLVAQLAEALSLVEHHRLAEFDITALQDGGTILTVSADVGAQLVERYRDNLEALTTMDRREFEELVAEIFNRFGFTVELTARTRDGGRDVIAIRHNLVAVKYLIECKRPDPGGYVGVAPVRELLGVKTDEQATKAVLATTARFSSDAKLLFERNSWVLEGRDYGGVVDWLESVT